MVFLCGLVNVLITVTKLRKHIIKSIPASLQNAIGGGIDIFVAYIGMLNIGLVEFSSGVPAMAALNQPALWLFLIGLVLTIVLLLLNVKGAILIGILVSTVIGIPMGLTAAGDTVSFSQACAVLPTTFGVIFTKEGLPSLFADPGRLPLVLIAIFSFCLSDTFDTIGTFIGTGRRSGIFSQEDEASMESGAGFRSKMDKALFADATATSIGAVFGTSNNHLCGKRRGNRRRRTHRPDQRGGGRLLRSQRLPGLSGQRHSLRRHGARPGDRGHYDDVLLPGNRLV